MTPLNELIRRLDCVVVEDARKQSRAPASAAVYYLPEDVPTGTEKKDVKTLQDIKKELYPRHPESERQFKKAGQSLTYIPWHEATRILDKATGGYWEYEITRMDQVGSNVVVAVRVTIHAEDGNFSVDGQGVEAIDVKGYGDPFSNAESMAYRRACAKLGLGLYLYKKD